MRDPCCSVGYGGENPPLPWHIYWLPKGYAPTLEDRFVCAFPDPGDGSWDDYGLGSKSPRPPLIEAVCKAIEEFAKANPETLPGRLLLVRHDGELVHNDRDSDGSGKAVET